MFEFREIRCPKCGSLVPIGYPICPYCGYDLRPLLRLQARQELTFRDYIRRVRDSIPLYGARSPSDLFKELMIAPDFIGPLLILAGIGFLFSLILLRVYFGMGGAFGYLRLWFLVPLALFSTLALILLFFLYVVVVNWLLKLLGTTTDFATTASIVGYSLWPSLFATLVALFVSLGLNPATWMGNLALVATDPLVTIIRYIILAGMLATIVIASEGISKAYHVNRLLTIVVLALPLILLLAPI